MNLKILSDYSWHKCESCISKKIILGIIGGFFIALGCAAFLRIYCANGIAGEGGLALLAGGFVFSTGFVMCTLFGGNIFTSNCAALQSVFEKKQKHRHFWLDMFIVTISNYVGGAILAGICYGIGMFGHDGNMFSAVLDFCKHKINMSGNAASIGWSFLSAIVTNILVITALLIFILTENKVVGLLGLIMVITIFVIGGYQHVVADFFFTTLGLIMDKGATTGLAWQTFAYCLIPVAFGNFIGGFIMIVICNLLWGNSKNKTKKNRS